MLNFAKYCGIMIKNLRRFGEEMENKKRTIRLIAMVCALTLIILTALPGCTFIGQAKNEDITKATVVDNAGNQLCCPICRSTDITEGADGTYTCNSCGKQWKYDQTKNQINVVDSDGNVISTVDTSAGYVDNSSGSGNGNGDSGSSGSNGNNGSSGNGGNSSSGNNSSGGGNNNNGNSNKNNSTTATKFDAQKFVKDLRASLKRFGESIDIEYDEETDSWTVYNNGKDTGLFGFKYSNTDKVFYTAENAWQRNFGYMETYDNFAGAGAISYDTIRVKFNYEGKEWMMQFWKGQYGFVLIGAELGIYNRKENSTSSSYYECVSDADKLNMSMKVYRKESSTSNKYKLLFSRTPTTTWWLTGFTPGTLRAGSYDVGEDYTKHLRVESTINFKNPQQAQAFIGGLKNTTEILHNSPRRTRSISFTEVSAADFETNSKSAKYAVASNGSTVYVSWR